MLLILPEGHESLIENKHQVLIRLNEINSERLIGVKLQSIKGKFKNVNVTRQKKDYMQWMAIREQTPQLQK